MDELPRHRRKDVADEAAQQADREAGKEVGGHGLRPVHPRSVSVSNILITVHMMVSSAAIAGSHWANVPITVRTDTASITCFVVSDRWSGSIT